MKFVVAFLSIIACLAFASVASAAINPPQPSGLTFVPDPGTQTSSKTDSAFCGDCGGSAATGCGTVGDQRSDRWGNNARSLFHWCWSYGQIYNNYGWTEQYPCWGFCSSNGFSYAYSFGSGYRSQAAFNYVNVGVWHGTSYIATCIAVSGWGSFWQC